jgi:chromosome segregation ATPase
LGQELECRARERYDALDRLNADFRWYQGQYEALEALAEAHRSPDRWLAYRAEALLDSPSEQGAQAAEGASAVVRVRTVLVEWDDALRRAREDLEGARFLASTWEAEVATARVQLQQGRAALQKAEGLMSALADKAAALTTTEEQLWQDRAARQEVEGQLQRERAALVEVRATLEKELMAHEEALGQLQRERTALEEARATLQKQQEEVSRLNGELVQISISHEDQRQSLEVQEASYLKLQRKAEEMRQSLNVEKKQVEGEFVSVRFSFVDSSFWDLLPTSSFLVRGFQACGPPWGTRPPGPRLCKRPTTPLNRSWKSCGLLPSRPARQLRRARCKPRACWQVACVLSAGTSRGVCAAPFTSASRRPSTWWYLTTG